MVKFKRVLQLLKEPVILIRKIIHRLPTGLIKSMILSFPDPEQLALEVRAILLKNEGKIIYVFPSPNCPWGYMFQRPQQLARALAAEGNLVFYMTDTSYPYSPDWNVRGALEVEPGIHLFNNGGNNMIEEFTDENIVLWQYWPHQYEYVQKVKEVSSNLIHVYDTIDDITTFDSYNDIQNDYYRSLNDSNIVLATSLVIYNQIKSVRNDVVYVPNGVEINDFNKLQVEIPSISIIKKQYKSIIGYYGAIAEWYDFQLLKDLSKKYPEWAFINVGEVYSEVQNKVDDFKMQDNVFFLKRISYEMIPSLLFYFDVAIIPFVINDITLSTSPVKAFEYLAGGKEIVSTDLPEVESIDVEFVAKNNLEFEEKLKYALVRSSDLDRISYLKSLAEQHTWKERVSNVVKEINQERRVQNIKNSYI